MYISAPTKVTCHEGASVREEDSTKGPVGNRFSILASGPSNCPTPFGTNRAGALEELWPGERFSEWGYAPSDGPWKPTAQQIDRDRITVLSLVNQATRVRGEPETSKGDHCGDSSVRIGRVQGQKAPGARHVTPRQVSRRQTGYAVAADLQKMPEFVTMGPGDRSGWGLSRLSPIA